MNYADIISKFFYNDTANVYRAVKTRVGKSDDFEMQYELIYDNLPCHLAQYGPALSAHRDDKTMEVSTDLRLNYSPDIHINDNDIVKVTHRGIELTLIASNEFQYKTHNCCSVRRRKQAGQK